MWRLLPLCKVQRVRPAFELFSDTVSKAFLYLFGNEMSEQARIISVIDKWADVMKSGAQFHYKTTRCGLGKTKLLDLRTVYFINKYPGIHEGEQMEALLAMQDLLSQMYFKTSKGNLGKKQFQAGIAVSIKSTIDLYNELKSQGVKYLLTTRINQDCLENLFSTVRFMGGNDCHPSAKDFATRMRNICL